MFKINIAEKSGKTYKLELETEEFLGKELHNKIQGKELLPNLNGYEFEITGASDKSGFTAHEDVQGVGTKRILLTYGKAMKKRPRKEGKKKVSNPKPKGLRLRKTVRGRVISPEIVQINLKILKEGSKKLSEIFPDQNKPKEQPKEEAKQEPQPEVKPAEKKEEAIEHQPKQEEPKKEEPK
jgi:small subunit ribosomal protein S6e